MIEIQLSLIVQIIFYGMALGIFYFTTKWILTGLNDGFHFDIKCSEDFLTVLILDGVAVILIIAGLHFGEIINVV